jgi:phosphoglycolate phosphatase
MNRARPLIFDLDGTLVDSLPGIAEALNQALSKRGFRRHPPEAVRGMIGSGATELCRRALPDAATASEIAALEEAFREAYHRLWPESTVPFPGIADLLHVLQARGHPLAVLSNKPDPFAREMVTALFHESLFDRVVGQIEGAARKPDPASIAPILGHWQVLPGDSLLIGDSDIDRQTAAAAGMPFLGVAWGYQDPARLGPRVAATVADLQTRIETSTS